MVQTAQVRESLKCSGVEWRCREGCPRQVVLPQTSRHGLSHGCGLKWSMGPATCWWRVNVVTDWEVELTVEL